MYWDHDNYLPISSILSHLIISNLIHDIYTYFYLSIIRFTLVVYLNGKKINYNKQSINNIHYQLLLIFVILKFTFFILYLSWIDDKDDREDIRILNELENIDDELDKEGIVIVRLDDENEAKEYGIDHLPTLVYFENKIPAIYEGNIFFLL